MNTFKRIGSTLGALALCLAPALGFAQTNVLTNGSFEDVPFATSGSDGSYCYTRQQAFRCSADLSGWSGDFALMASDSRPWGASANTATDRFQIGLQRDSSIEQLLQIANAGTYTLSWSDAGRRHFDIQHYDVSFGGASLGNFTTLAGQDWSSHSVTFNAAAGSHLLLFQGLTNHRTDGTAFIDNISLTTAVPEPTTWALMLGGLLGVGFVARRRTRND